MKWLRYVARLLREFCLFARVNKAWWIVPVIIALLLAAVVVTMGTTVAPFIYTLF